MCDLCGAERRESDVVQKPQADGCGPADTGRMVRLCQGCVSSELAKRKARFKRICCFCGPMAAASLGFLLATSWLHGGQEVSARHGVLIFFACFYGLPAFMALVMSGITMDKSSAVLALAARATEPTPTVSTEPAPDPAKLMAGARFLTVTSSVLIAIWVVVVVMTLATGQVVMDSPEDYNVVGPGGSRRAATCADMIVHNLGLILAVYGLVPTLGIVFGYLALRQRDHARRLRSDRPAANHRPAN